MYVFRIESKYCSSYTEGMQRGYHERIPKILAIIVQRPTLVVFGIHQKPLLPGTEVKIRVITKLPNYEQYYKGKVKTNKYINRQNQSTTEKL
jgi:hypothetical protein